VGVPFIGAYPRVQPLVEFFASGFGVVVVEDGFLVAAKLFFEFFWVFVLGVGEGGNALPIFAQFILEGISPRAGGNGAVIVPGGGPWVGQCIFVLRRGAFGRV